MIFAWLFVASFGILIASIILNYNVGHLKMILDFYSSKIFNIHSRIFQAYISESNILWCSILVHYSSFAYDNGSDFFNFGIFGRVLLQKLDMGPNI